MLAIPQGLEPRTVCLEGRCSILLSYGTKLTRVKARAQRCAAFSFTQCPSMKKGRGSSSPLFRGPLATAGNHKLLSAVLILASLSLPFFLPFLDFLPASAEAPLEQHPAEADLLQDAPLDSVDAEAPLEQQPADLLLSHDAFPSVEAEAPLAQHPADLDLSQLAFLPSLEQVCSVLALLSAGASVD